MISNWYSLILQCVAREREGETDRQRESNYKRKVRDEEGVP
jgi:hypothetical protein